MTEQFTNQPSAPLTLGAPAGSGDAALVLSGAFGSLPTVGTYRLLVDSEIMIATARVGSVVTVTRGAEGTTAVAHLVGALVYASLTAGAIAQMRVDLGNFELPYVDVLTDAATTIYTLAPVLAGFEDAKVWVEAKVEEIGSGNPGGSIARFCHVINVGGTIQSVLNGATTNFDFDASYPAPPNNLAPVIAATTAKLLSSGSDLVFKVTRPPGVAIRARLTVSVSRSRRPSGPYALSLSPNSGNTGGGTTVVISGESLAGATSVTFNGVAQTVVSSNDTSVTVTTTPGSAGTGDVVVVCAAGTVTAPGAWTYVAGIVPTVASITPNTSKGEGGAAAVIVGTNFTGALAVTLNGVAQSYVVNSSTQITIAAVTAAGAHQGLGDVIVTSSTSNTNAAGNNLWFWLPTGMWTWNRSDIGITTSGGNVTSWADIGFPAGSAHYPLVNGTYAYNAADATMNNKPTVAQQSGVGNINFQGTGPGAGFTGTAHTRVAFGIRSTTLAGSRLMFEGSNAANPDTADPSGITVLDNMPGATTLTLARNGVTATSATGTAPSTSTPFCISVRDSGSTAILRINGADIATIATNGAAYNMIERTLGMGWAGGGAGPEGASRWAEDIDFDHLLSGAEMTVMNAYATWRYALTF